MHVNDIFAVGLESECDVFRDELNRMVPVKTFGELRWYGSCHFTREWNMDTLTISQKTFADVVVVVFTLKAVPVSTQYFLASVLVQLTRTPSVVTG